MSTRLDNIRIVLVRPTHPGNVGAVARAMKTMALRRLHLVAPCPLTGPEADARAVGAADVLRDAVTCESFAQAVGECHLVIGTSARRRHIDWPALDPGTAAQALVEAAGKGPVALVFGQERTGLTNEELDRCRYVVGIPANPEFASLNLAGAVQVLAYEIYRASRQDESPPPAASLDEAPVREEEREQLFRHWETVLIEIGFLDPANPRFLMRRMRRLFNRAALDRNELNILRGVLTAVQQRLRS